MGPEFAPPPPQSPSSSTANSPFPPEPPRPRRLMRSRHERMWAGVAGGMAEYFDLDPNLVRLLWVAATVVSHGAGVAVYILFWVILPREERTIDAGTHDWRDWSQEFHTETQRLAEEARRVADDVRGTGQGWRAPTSPEPMTDPRRYAELHRHHDRHPRSTGIVLVTLGVVLLAANAGLFNWINWPTMWPVIFIALGLILLARRAGWGR
jgi:phage shock protein C